MKRFAVFSLFPVVSVAAHAEVFRHVDPVTGHVTLSNVSRYVPLPAATAAPSTVVTAKAPRPSVNASASGSADNFPRVSTSQQRERDNGRRQILADELKAEQESFDKAKARNAPDPDISRHKANIAALQRELANMK